MSTQLLKFDPHECVVIPSSPFPRYARALTHDTSTPTDNRPRQPHLSYSEIFSRMVDGNLHRTSREFLPEARRALATVLTLVLPKGCLIRTAQVGFARGFRTVTYDGGYFCRGRE